MVVNFTNHHELSLSEWGCIKNRPRNFEEMGALMNSEMTSVYSGGLLYEYSMEANDYGIVNIKGDSADPTNEFKMYASALAQDPAPDGNGGAASTSHGVPCPTMDPNWQVNPSLVPQMPSEAEKFMKDGAGQGPGLDGSGSQQAGDSGTATASVSEGTSSPTSTSSSSSDESAGVSMHGSLSTGPVLVSGAVIIFTLLGACLL